MAKRGGESAERQTRRGPLASRSALRTLLSLAFAVTGVIFAVGLILAGRGALADVLRDVLAPWFGAGRWLVPGLLIVFAVWIERRSASASRVPLRIALSLFAIVGLLALIEIVAPTHGGRIGSIAGGGAASLRVRLRRCDLHCSQMCASGQCAAHLALQSNCRRCRAFAPWSSTPQYRLKALRRRRLLGGGEGSPSTPR